MPEPTESSVCATGFADDLRILSLLSSATEIVHALGLGQYQIGRSHECDFPPAVRSLPVCSEPAIPVNGSSAEIDFLIKQRVSQALSIYTLDHNLIAKLQPTHIITQTQCKVCAVSLEDLELALQFQLGTNAKVISLEPFAICDVWKDILHVGAACGVQDHAAALISDLKQRMANLSAAHTAKTSRPRVAALEWLEPLMAAGNWVPELITKAGGENLFGEAGQHSPWMTWDELLRADPGVIVALPCGFDLARTRAEMNWLTRRTGWSQLKAVQNGQVYLCDGNQYMNRPGPRLVESLQIFCEILHPELFAPDLRGSAWEPLE